MRTEIHGSRGYVATDHTGQTGGQAFAGSSAGYILEKAGSDRGWVRPVPDEAHAYGYQAEMDHFVHALLAGTPPRQAFRDGVIDNAVTDAAYRSMASGRWERVDVGDLA